MKYLNKKPNCLSNIIIFISINLPRMILPLNKINVKHNPTYITAISVVLIFKDRRLAQKENHTKNVHLLYIMDML